jgi:hypothetical protein
VLNLCHAGGHDAPRPLVPGEPLDVEVAMRSIAYAVPAGHRLRLSLSTAYWPWLWPSPEPVEIAVHAGASTLELPLRTPRAEDEALAPFAPPETAPPLPVEELVPARPQHVVTRDEVAGTTSFLMSRRFVGARRFPSGLEYHDDDPITFTIADGDPLSARVECRRRIEVRRGDAWRTRIDMLATMTADADDFHVASVLEAHEGDVRVHVRTASASIPRDHC